MRNEKRKLNYKQIRKIFSIAGILFLLFLVLGGCDQYERIMNKVYAPKEKAKATRKVIISGKVDPGITLVSFDVLYETNRKICKKNINWLEGVSSPREHRVSYPVKMVDGSYRAEIETDKLESGFCKWDVKLVEFSLSMGEGEKSYHTDLIWLYKNGVESLPLLKVLCQTKFKYNSQDNRTFCVAPGGPNYRANIDTKMINSDFLVTTDVLKNLPLKNKQ